MLISSFLTTWFKSARLPFSSLKLAKNHPSPKYHAFKFYVWYQYWLALLFSVIVKLYIVPQLLTPFRLIFILIVKFEVNLEPSLSLVLIIRSYVLTLFVLERIVIFKFLGLKRMDLLLFLVLVIFVILDFAYFINIYLI